MPGVRRPTGPGRLPNTSRGRHDGQRLVLTARGEWATERTAGSRTDPIGPDFRDLWGACIMLGGRLPRKAAAVAGHTSGRQRQRHPRKRAADRPPRPVHPCLQLMDEDVQD